MAQSDDIARLTQVLVRMHQGTNALAQVRRQASGLSASQVGKAAGCTAEQVYLWESGTVSPSTGQALAWLSALYERPPAAPDEAQ